jgi:hypothetical protein
VTIPADDNFLEVLGDYQMLLGEIGRIEKASGTVEIPVSLAELRQRASAKLAKLGAWITEHKVGGWRYDFAAKAFFPPPPPASTSPSPGAAEKKDEKKP